MVTVLFACVHNAGRSQMAAALFNALADPAKARAVSAGTQPATHVHPEVVRVMAEIGLDVSAARPQRLTDDLARQANILVTMGCAEECPAVPGMRVIAWQLDDPKGQGDDTARAIRDRVRDHVVRLLEDEGLGPAPPAAVACTLSPEELSARRMALLPGLVTRATHVDITGHLARLHFAPDPGIVPAIAEVLEAERRCCRFLRFELTVAPNDGEVTLLVSAPPGTTQLLTDLLRPEP